MNYEEDIRIDETALDIEWLEQPALMLKYARHAAEMLRAHDRKKEKLSVMEAQIDLAIRENPKEYGLEKIVEAAVKNVIIQQDQYIELKEELLEASYELKMAEKAVQAFSQRKDALENLVRLHGQQYFAGPKVPRDLVWEREEKQKQADKAVGSAMKRRTR